MRQQHAVTGRHRVEQRRPVLLDDRVDVLRRRRARPQDRRRADRERKIQRVAEAVGEEQLRHAEAAIRGGHAEDAFARTARRRRPCRAAGARTLSARRCCPTNTARTPARRGWSARPRASATPSPIEARTACARADPSPPTTMMCADATGARGGNASNCGSSSALTITTPARESRTTYS